MHTLKRVHVPHLRSIIFIFLFKCMHNSVRHIITKFYLFEYKISIFILDYLERHLISLYLDLVDVQDSQFLKILNIAQCYVKVKTTCEK